MIITKLLGGLGNQMFQYASAYAVAKDNKTNLALDVSWYVESNSVVWTMDYSLDYFNISAKKINNKDYRVVDRIDLRNKFNKYTVKEFKEAGLRFDSSVFKAGKKLVLDGYWQSEKYFAKYRMELLKEFSLKKEMSEKASQLAELIVKSQNAVSLHVRRGDYANHAQTNATHGLMGLEYYNLAVSKIEERDEAISLFIFSDDLEWCKTNLKFKQDSTYIAGNLGFEDMHLMSLCDHNIIANSSFSWWGAWLNKNPNKIVIAPKKWFNDPSLDSTDIVPEDWIRV